MNQQNSRAAFGNDAIVGRDDGAGPADRGGEIPLRMRMRPQIPGARGNHRGDAEGDHGATPDAGKTGDEHAQPERRRVPFRQSARKAFRRELHSCYNSYTILMIHT